MVLLGEHGLEARATTAKPHGPRRKASLAGLAGMAVPREQLACPNTHVLAGRVPPSLRDRLRRRLDWSLMWRGVLMAIRVVFWDGTLVVGEMSKACGEI